MTERDLPVFTVFGLPFLSPFVSSGGGSSSRACHACGQVRAAGERVCLPRAPAAQTTFAEVSGLGSTQSDRIHWNFMRSLALGRFFSSLMKQPIRNSVRGCRTAHTAHAHIVAHALQ